MYIAICCGTLKYLKFSMLESTYVVCQNCPTVFNCTDLIMALPQLSHHRLLQLLQQSPFQPSSSSFSQLYEMLTRITEPLIVAYNECSNSTTTVIDTCTVYMFTNTLSG